MGGRRCRCRTIHGYFIGAGGEFSLGNNLALRAEYRFANYGGETSASTSETITPDAHLDISRTSTVSNDVDLQIQTIRAALVFKLGTP